MFSTPPKRPDTSLGFPRLIFVYGTLKRGHRNHGRLDGAPFVAEATTCDPFVLMAGRIPVMFVQPGEGLPVVGELYAVSTGLLAKLDWFEGHPAFYERTPISVHESSSGAMRVADAYLYRGPLTGDLVRLGDRYVEVSS